MNVARLLAGAQLIGMGAVWLVAWAPMLVLALVVASVSALRGQAGRLTS